MIKAIIVDDEKPSREVIKEYLKTYLSKEVEIVATANSFKSAIKSIKLLKPELVFLDIEMPNGNGFDLLRQFDTPRFKVIFITAHSEFAIKAFRFFASDYLMKPLNINELIEAVHKVKSELDKESDYSNIKALLKFNQLQVEEFNELYVKHQKGFDVLKIDDIVYCKSDASYTEFHLLSGKKTVSSKSLGHYEDLLKEKSFIRTHHSFLINKKHITGYQNDGVINLAGNVNVPLGDAYRKCFMYFFKKC